MKQTIILPVVLAILGASCTKQEPPEPQRWTSSLAMKPIDITTPEGRVAWSNAVVALRATVAEQEAKVVSMRSATETKTNDTFVASLNEQETLLEALKKRLKEELANGVEDIGAGRTESSP